MRLIPFLAIAIGALTHHAQAQAQAQTQSYPAKPIRISIIIPFPSDNSMDIMSRLVEPKLTERLGNNVLVDNRAGAADQLGLDLPRHAKARLKRKWPRSD